MQFNVWDGVVAIMKHFHKTTNEPLRLVFSAQVEHFCLYSDFVSNNAIQCLSRAVEALGIYR